MQINYDSLYQVIRKFNIISYSDTDGLQLELITKYSYEQFNALIDELKSLVPRGTKVTVNCEGITFLKGPKVSSIYDYVMNKVKDTVSPSEYYFKGGAVFFALN